MKPSLRAVVPGVCSFLAFSLLLAAVPGCSPRPASRPASALSEKDRTLLDRYEDIRATLASDDLRGVKRAGAALSAFLKKTPDAGPTMTADVESISTATALDRARQSFEPLSASMVKIADGVDGYYILETPIPAGAQWVQRTALPDNPYTGKAMRDIGTLRK